MVGLADRLDHRPSQLSGGQQQRVAVARALASRPEIIFGDEPTGNLDSRSGAEVLGFLRNSVRELGQTVVMVTHDPVAAAYADRVVFLADGRIVDELYEPTADSVLDRMKRSTPGPHELTARRLPAAPAPDAPQPSPRDSRPGLTSSMFRTALRNVFAHKARLLMTVLAVLLGVAFVSGTLVFTNTISDAFQKSSAKGFDQVDVAVQPADRRRRRRHRRQDAPS